MNLSNNFLLSIGGKVLISEKKKKGFTVENTGALFINLKLCIKIYAVHKLRLFHD